MRHPASRSMMMSPFQSTLSMRRAIGFDGEQDDGVGISIHALHEESDRVHRHLQPEERISIHALHEESDVRIRVMCRCSTGFQSTLSMRRAMSERGEKRTALTFQSTLSMRRAIVHPIHACCHSRRISIHALHEESDSGIRRFRQVRSAISIHALHEESDQADQTLDKHPRISIHALHEESDQRDRRDREARQISIHALHEESDVTLESSSWEP